MAFDTLGHLLALHVTPANAEGRDEVERLARTMQTVTNDAVELAWVDRGYTGTRAADAEVAYGIVLEAVAYPKPTRLRPSSVPLGRRTVVCLGNALPSPRQKL